VAGVEGRVSLDVSLQETDVKKKVETGKRVKKGKIKEKRT
jgi:hypothetical protein